jgi:glycine/D-amino acid oxidase-like deaminating enzyme
MSSLPDRARVVVIGAGIVGSSMAWHLARLGWRDIVLLEKGMLPNPGGSTGHARNFIFLTDHSKEMTAFTLDSARQYRELGVYDETGGIEVARTPERMEELKRRIASSRSWGIEDTRLLTRRGQGDGPVHRGVGDPGRLLHPGRRDRRQPPGRDADAAEGPGDGRPDGRGQRRGHRHRRRGRPRPSRPHGPGRHRGGDGRHRLRRLEPADREDGRRVDPADAGRSTR